MENLAANATQNIQNYVWTHREAIQRSLVNAFQFDFARFETVQRNAEMSAMSKATAPNDVNIRTFVLECRHRWTGAQLKQAFRGFRQYVPEDQALGEAVAFIESVLPDPAEAPPEEPAGASPFAAVRPDPERFKKIERFKRVTELLQKRRRLADLCYRPPDACPEEKPAAKCQLHGDTLGMGQEVCRFDGRTGRALYMVTLLAKVKLAVEDVGKGGAWSVTMADLSQAITDFFDEVEHNILERKRGVLLDTIKETQAVLRGMVEDPRVKRKASDFVEVLGYYRVHYTATNLFIYNNEFPPQKKDRELLSKVNNMPGQIKALQWAMIEKAESECAVSAGAIDHLIRKDTRIKTVYNPGLFKIVTTLDCAVLQQRVSELCK